MTPDVVVDIGNSRIKWGRVRDGRVVEAVSLPHDDPVKWKRYYEAWGLSVADEWAIAGVNPTAIQRLTDWLAGRTARLLHISTPTVIALTDEEEPLDFSVGVDEPERVGVDRLLGAISARYRTPRTTSAIVIGVGTAMTVDFVDLDGRFVGGAILPGPRLMARSLHQYTAKLPEVGIDPALPVRIAGTNTEEAIELGIASAVLGAADQLVWDWFAGDQVPPRVFVTGGDAGYFKQFVFTADVERVVHDPTLVLDGVRRVAEALS